MSNRVPATTTQDASTGDEHIRAAIAHLQAAMNDEQWLMEQWRRGLRPDFIIRAALSHLFTFAPPQP